MDIEYFAGGFDPAKPGGNVHVTVEHHGDGTGTRTVYSSDGTVESVAEVSGLPVPAPVTDHAAVALAAAQTAANEVAGFSAGSGTRQAVEALVTAVRALVQRI